MTNQNNRGGDDAASSNTPAEPERKHESGGNMGAGKSGGKNFAPRSRRSGTTTGAGKPGATGTGIGSRLGGS